MNCLLEINFKRQNYRNLIFRKDQLGPRTFRPRSCHFHPFGHILLGHFSQFSVSINFSMSS